MFSITQNTKESAYEQNNNLIGISETLSTFDTSHDILNIIFCYLKHKSVLIEKNNLDNCKNLVFCFAKNLLKTSLPNKSLAEFINDPFNIENIFRFSNTRTYPKENIFYDQFLNTRFYPAFLEMMDWNASSNSLEKNTILNCLLERRNARTKETREPLIWLNEINNCVSKNDFKQPSTYSLGHITPDSNESKKLNLLCVFTNKADYEEISSGFNKMHHSEDIRIILPMTWNIVVAYNVLTLSDENNQHITIFFRNPLTAKFDYKLTNLPSDRKFKFNSSEDKTDTLNDRIHSSRTRKFIPPFKITTKINHDFEPLIRRNSPLEYKFSNQVGKKKIRSDCFLLLKEPILLNYIDQNKTKQMLMYKAHSLENVLKDRNKSNTCKILEKLIAKSVKYSNEPVHVVFEPLKLMKRLKKEKIISFNVAQYSKCKHDLLENRIYKKLLQCKDFLNFSDARYEEKTRTVPLKNESTIQANNKSKMSDQLLISTYSCLDLPKNFATAATNQNVDMDEYRNEVGDKSVITTASCSELPKNFSKFVTKKENDTGELFSSKQSNTNFPRQVNRTALKQVNVKQVVSSVFRHFFHFYSMYGGNLRSGAVITRSNSNYWLKISGVATDSATLKVAGDLFNTVAGRKIVLNIFDYIKFLAIFARNRRLLITEIVRQMMAFEQLSEPVFSKEKCKKCRKMKNSGKNEPNEFRYDTYLSINHSLPNMWNHFDITSSNADIQTRNCFSQEIL